MNNDITILQGGQAGFQIYRDDATATSVTFLMKNDATGTTYAVSSSYDVNGVAGIDLNHVQTGIVGTYSYQINENIPGQDARKYGDLGCTDCDLPKIYICASIDGTMVIS